MSSKFLTFGFISFANAVPKIYLFKPVQMTVSSVFILLIIYTVGNAWAKFLPRSSWVRGTRLEFLTPVIVFVNPGEFSLKEVSGLLITPMSHIYFPIL